MKNEYVKSPLNYTGGKHKLLPQIMPLFPKSIGRFVDLFCGGADVGVNVTSKKCIMNDIDRNVTGILSSLKECKMDYILSFIKEKIEQYGFSDVNKNGYEFYGCQSSDGVGAYNKGKYMKLRHDLNEMERDSTMYYLTLYTTIIFSFNNQIRFNSKGEFNMPVGKRDFNKNMKEKLENFINTIQSINCTITNFDFRELKPEKLNTDDFVYCDPPYLITCASYNENDAWNENDENDLYSILDKLNEKGISFGLSNVIYNKGKTNDILLEWSKKYNIYHLNHTYSNCNYHSLNKTKGTTDEVFVCNY